MIKITKNFNNAIKKIIVQSFYNNIASKEWVVLNSYKRGDYVTYEGKQYIALYDITSSTATPSSSNLWKFISLESTPLNVCLGFNSKSESDANLTDITKSIISKKRIQQNEIHLGLLDSQWVSGKTYSTYSDTANNYVIIEDNVYICLDNNSNANSTVKPVIQLINSGVQETSDGYVWKHVGSIKSYYKELDVIAYTEFKPNNNKLASEGVIKVEPYANQNGTVTSALDTFVITDSGNGAEFDYVVGAGGILTNIVATKSGAGYSKDDLAVTYEKTSNGSGALSNAILENGKVKSAVMLNAGDNYDTANVVIVGDGTGATGTATVVNNKVTDVVITNQGVGYTKARIIVVAGSFGCVSKLDVMPDWSSDFNCFYDVIKSFMCIRVDSSQHGIVDKINEVSVEFEGVPILYQRINETTVGLDKSIRALLSITL